jgi:LPXTG-motif cell wall-anchored protein
VKLNSDGGKAVRAGARSQRRRRGALVSAVCGLTLVAVAALGAGTAGAQEGEETPTTEDTTVDTTPAPLAEVEPLVDAGEIITITQEPLVVDGACNPLAQAQLTYTTESTDEVFELVITSATNPCTPIAAAAVAYAMPAGASPAGGQWPQTLSERKDFTISQASVTTVTFAKECAALQFDVITGESPQTIAPTGPWHGPLLFVGDTNTSQQYFPPVEQCGGTTTTTSTVPVTVLPATTLPQVATNVVTPDATVADTSATNNGGEGAALALTGSSSGPLALVGGLLLVAGAVMFALSRRTREA